MMFNKQSFTGSKRKIALEIRLEDNLRSKVDNENNYNTIFVLSQNIDKNNCHLFMSS